MSVDQELVRAFKVDGDSYIPFSTTSEPLFTLPAAVYNPRLVVTPTEEIFILQHVDKRFSLDENLEFDDDQIKFVEAIMDARREKRRSNAVLIGKPGSGKTTTMSKIANLAIFQDHPVVMFSYVPSGREMKEWFQRLGETPTVFIIDELASKQKLNEYIIDLEKQRKNTWGNHNPSLKGEPWGSNTELKKKRGMSRVTSSNIVDNDMRSLLSDSTWSHHTVLFSLFDYESMGDISSLVDYQIDLSLLSFSKKRVGILLRENKELFLTKLTEVQYQELTITLCKGHYGYDVTPSTADTLREQLMLSVEENLDLVQLLALSMKIYLNQYQE